jgi:hypothetical protein
MSSAAGGVPGDHRRYSPHPGPFADTVHQTLASTNRRRPGLNPSTTHEQGLGKVRACWFHEACDADQWQQTGGMAAQRGATRASDGTDRPIAVNVNVRHRGVGNPAARTVLSCGYRCVTDSVPLVAR